MMPVEDPEEISFAGVPYQPGHLSSGRFAPMIALTAIDDRINRLQYRITMSEPIEILGTYLHLAAQHGKRLMMSDRDRFLVISAVIAEKIGLFRVAAYCRHLILENNPGHMVKRWSTLKSALEDTDFLHFLKQVQRRFPQERAEQLLLEEFKIVRANERAAYYDDEEYAAALLGIEVEWLRNHFGDAGKFEN